MREDAAGVLLDSLDGIRSGIRGLEKEIRAGIEPGESNDINGGLSLTADKVHCAIDELDDAEDIFREVCNFVRGKGARTVEDPVNHPAHYELSGGVECFDVIMASQGVEAAKGFCAGNAIKYLFRAPRKNGTEDHKKARWYIDKLIELEDSDD